jgi:hypothetical protein
LGLFGEPLHAFHIATENEIFSPTACYAEISQ